MHIKIDNNFKTVAQQLADYPEIRPAEQVSAELGAALEKAGIIEDIPDLYGKRLADAACDQLVQDVYAVLAAFLGKKSVSCVVWDAYCNAIVMGDGDCPECGGHIRREDAVGHELHDGDYMTPNSYIVDYYVCPVCGAHVKIR